MFKRIRQLHISLAAKCQLLFGAAVVLIITAALLVPWQRMEQLMEQMNERTAKTLADWAEADHVARQMEEKSLGPATRPTTGPSTAPALGGRERAVVNLILLSRPPKGLSRFETKAMEDFKKNAEIETLSKRQENKEGPTSFKYARALQVTPARQKQCMACHSEDVQKGESAAHSNPPLLGMVSIEIPYQVDAMQVFLNRIFIFLAGLLAGTTAIIVFYLITTRLILGPVRVLQETAEKVSKGDLNIRSDISTGDEFQQLSETFNKMLTNLKAGEDQLRAINKSLDLKLGQLEESNVALYESNRLKNEFLANVSHELRTPLNSILGFADLLKDAALTSDPKNARYLQNIVNSGKNLLALITDLLDLAKIEAGRMEVRSEPLSLTDLFEGLVSIIKPLAEKKELSVVATVGRDVPIMQTDPAKLQQVLYNFLSNAIKFSPATGRIDVKAERFEEDNVRISVTDLGPGIELDKQSVIFEKFRQIDGSVTRQHSGTGLGLAISKELTQLMGGSIGVMSRPNEGATFWVILPVKIVAQTQPFIPTASPALPKPA
ncbi:MAG TPA: ATP-binding protein [Tepidisphaeraceae bacterium]|jgi:signal transduction histidine kinase|nr:ATP-binding protein [Tepidisphaeraceae bacterium]